MKRWYDAFFDGYKPAMLLEAGHKYVDRAMHYPHIAAFDGNPNNYMFFQTVARKENYMHKMSGVDIGFGSHDFHYHTGIALGFPEQSVAAYSKWRVVEDRIGKYPSEERQISLGLMWAGFSFASYHHCYEHDIQWLWQAYNDSKATEHAMHIHTDDNAYTLQYGDHAELERVCEAIAVHQVRATQHT